METKKILPRINNIDFAGRIYGKPIVNETGTRAAFSVIRNFGGDKEAVILDFVKFRKPSDPEFPEFLKSGSPVVVHAYFNPDDYTNREGKAIHKVQFVVKKVEKAETKNNVLPGINNIDFAGRLAADPKVNAAGTCAMFRLVRNFGGGKGSVGIDLTMLRRKDGPAFPDFLKQGKPVTVHAYFNPAVYNDSEGNVIEKIQMVIKKDGIAPAELVEKKFRTLEAADNVDAEPEEFADDAVSDVEIVEQ